MEIITGIALGLSTLLFIGAVFFYLIKTAIFYGRKAGVAVATGIILGDIIYVCLLLYGFKEILENELFTKWFALTGGLILIVIGVSYWFKKHTISEAEKTPPVSIWVHFVKGFALNFINPFVAAVWIGFLAVNEARFSDQNAVLTSLTVTLLVIFITDLLKVFFAEKLHRFLTPTTLKRAYKIMGFVMLIFGFRLIYAFVWD